MANLFEFDEEKLKKWVEWLSTRPQIIKDLAEKFPPNKLYLLKTSNHRVTIRSYVEDGTLTVNVSGEFNSIMFDRGVFGIKPEDLAECDLPKKDEKLGTVLTEEKEIDNFIEAIRPLL